MPLKDYGVTTVVDAAVERDYKKEAQGNDNEGENGRQGFEVSLPGRLIEVKLNLTISSSATLTSQQLSISVSACKQVGSRTASQWEVRC